MPMTSLDLALSRVSIEDILIDADLPIGSASHGFCPLHRGSGLFAFHFTKIEYHCATCGAHGSAVDLLQAIHGLSRKAAIDKLLALAGIGQEFNRLTDQGIDPESTGQPVYIDALRQGRLTLDVDRHQGNTQQSGAF